MLLIAAVPSPIGDRRRPESVRWGGGSASTFCAELERLMVRDVHIKDRQQILLRFCERCVYECLVKTAAQLLGRPTLTSDEAGKREVDLSISQETPAFVRKKRVTPVGSWVSHGGREERKEEMIWT